MRKKPKRNLTFLFLILHIFSSVVVVTYAWEIDKVSTVTQVIDGDSFKIQGDEIRLADVSAPEWNQPGGSSATYALKNLIDGKTVYLDTDDKSGRDPYGRLIAVVYLKIGVTQYKNVNKALLNQGVVSEDDYTNNEFNPSTWTLNVSAESSNGVTERNIIIDLRDALIVLAVILFLFYLARRIR